MVASGQLGKCLPTEFKFSRCEDGLFPYSSDPGAYWEVSGPSLLESSNRIERLSSDVACAFSHSYSNPGADRASLT